MLLFFYGVVLSVGGMGFIGYLGMVSQAMHIGIGPSYAKVTVGFLSAIVDNIPVMFAFLSMNPDMPLGHWLLVTLTAGVGGSMLSIGSTVGVTLILLRSPQVVTGDPAGLYREYPGRPVGQCG